MLQATQHTDEQHFKEHLHEKKCATRNVLEKMQHFMFTCMLINLGSRQ